MSTTTAEPRIRYPSARSLDTEGWRGDRHLTLYLIPAEEAGGGIPEITTHEYVGNRSWPMAAHHSRWTSIGGVGPNTIGTSVLEALREIEDLLVAVSDAYLGSEWDGSNHVGRWDVETPDEYGGMPGYDPRYELREAWRRLRDEQRRYWDAGALFGPAMQGWEELAEIYGADPDLVIEDGWEDRVRALAEEIEADQDEAVTGTADYLVASAEDYRLDRREA